MVNEVDSIGMEFDESKTMKTEETQVFLPARSARSSGGVSLVLFLLLAGRLVKIEKLCFLVHGKFIICFVKVTLGVFVNFSIPKPVVVSLL